jgi:urease accessory protein
LKKADCLDGAMQLVSGPLATANVSLPEVAVRVDRLTLAKRLWRGAAEDGAEFGFELAAPLKDGDVVGQTSMARYIIRQQPEPVLEISLEVASSAAAGIGWAIGNLHMELSAEPTRLLAPDDTAMRQLLDRLKVSYQPITAVFRPGRFARSNQQPHEIGPSHKH